MVIALVSLSLLCAALLVIIARLAWALFSVRIAALESRIADLEADRPGKRLSHRDTLNVENAQAAVLKALMDMDNLRDYLKNGLAHLGRVRTLGDDDDAK